MPVVVVVVVMPLFVAMLLRWNANGEIFLFFLKASPSRRKKTSE